MIARVLRFAPKPRPGEEARALRLMTLAMDVLVLGDEDPASIRYFEAVVTDLRKRHPLAEQRGQHG